MRVIDFRKSYGALYFPPAGRIVSVAVSPMRFATVDGVGDPTTAPAYRNAIEALYGVSYTTKFALKRAGVADYKVGPLESLWWTGAREPFHPGTPRDAWKWKAMIMQPDLVTVAQLRAATKAVAEQKGARALPRIRFELLEEGTAAQTTYVGPYSGEGTTVVRIHEFIEGLGGRRKGKHHEIYLSDPRRTAPARLRTVIRQPYVL
jgi:hypothetical protein